MGSGHSEQCPSRPYSTSVVRLRTVLCLIVISGLLAACGDDADDASSQQLAVTAKCEGLGPRSSDWRRQATAVGNFGLLVRKLSAQARGLGNGNTLVKAGAVVEGQEPVTVTVPEAEQGEVGLIYGDETQVRTRQVSPAAAEVTFTPCHDRARSGYVGGLIFAGVPRAVALEVETSESTEPLPLRP
jgi:hypothetical protein